MAGCGYLCPQCEGKGFLENMKECDWCSNSKENKNTDANTEEDIEAWIEKVHGSNCCSDIGNQ